MKKQKHKDFPSNLIKVKFRYLEEEIEYAKSQIQEHDTGHIYTAISWMESRLKQLKGIKENE